MSDPIALAEALTAVTTALDMLEGMVQQAIARGYTEEQARALVIFLTTGFKSAQAEAAAA